MGCRYEWVDDEHFIMNIYVEAPWTWEEYDAMGDMIFPLLRDVKHPCATVVDVSKMGSMPRGNVMSSLSRTERLLPENVFVSALVAAPYPAMVFMDILFRIRPGAKRRAIFTRTMPEAHQKIQELYQKQFASSDNQPK